MCMMCQSIAAPAGFAAEGLADPGFALASTATVAEAPPGTYPANALIFDDPYSRWNADAAHASPIVVTYSFLTRLPAYESEATRPGFMAYGGEYHDVTRAALADWESAAGIRFIEVAEGLGDIQFGFHNTATTNNNAAGYASYPYLWDFSDSATTFRSRGGDVWINTNGSQPWAPAQMTYLLRHEIGHAIGLKHPFDGEVRLTAQDDNRTNTVMSYTGPAIGSLGPYDREAARLLYGSAAPEFYFDVGATRVYFTGGQAGATHLGTSIADYVLGLGGADSIRGYGGDDFLFGGDGVDTVHGGDGNDLILGDDVAAHIGADQLFGGRGRDTIGGGAGADTIYGGANSSGIADDGDLILGGGGMDLVRGEGGADTIVGDQGEDALASQAGDSLDGGDGDDLVLGGFGADTLAGGAGKDTMTGEDGGDNVSGFSGDDLLLGGAGDDTLWGDDGADILSGEAGADSLTGGAGDDMLLGGDGNDSLVGSAGFNVMAGGAGDDLLYATTFPGLSVAGYAILLGDAGNDTIIGGWEADYSYGGAGADRFEFGGARARARGDIILDFTPGLGGDVLDLRDLSIFATSTATFRTNNITASPYGAVVSLGGSDWFILPGVTPGQFVDANILL